MFVSERVGSVTVHVNVKAGWLAVRQVACSEINS